MKTRLFFSPAMVDRGNLSCAKLALEKGKIAAVANGSGLGEFVKNHSLPAYIFDANSILPDNPGLDKGI